MGSENWKKEQKETEAIVRKILSDCPSCKLPPSTELSGYRGKGMIQAGLNFEFDHDLKSDGYPRDPNNHVFADILVPLRNEFKSPLVFWLDPTFPQGVNYAVHLTPKEHYVLQIGPRYDFRAIMSAVEKVMKKEKLDFPDWFNKRFKNP